MVFTSAHRFRPVRIIPAIAAVLVGLLAPVLAGPASAATGPAGSTSTGTTPTGTASPGYWLVASDGGVYQFGTTNYGGLRGSALNQPVVGGAATPDGQGYWLVASDGGIFSFGDARFQGSTGGIRLNKPVVGMAADAQTGGYWMVAADGGIFSFDAPFHGSTGGITLDKPVVAMVPTSDGGGYWLVASDGGVFAFGDARFYGSTGGAHLDAPVVAINSTADGNGYWMAGADGGIFNFGDAQMLGTAATPAGSAPIVAMIVTERGYPFPPGGTGIDISQFDCPYYQYQNAPLPTTPESVPVVQVSGGAIDQYQPAGCYQAEARWAGPDMSVYVFMNELPTPAPAVSLTGPAGTCNGDVYCESYNFGYYWAQQWVAYAHAAGTYPTLWWLDVESPSVWWADQNQQSNSQVIAGAVSGLRAAGVTPGLYSTTYQWDQITGGDVSFPGIPLWAAGAGNLSGGTYSALNMCAGLTPDHAPFAGGQTVLVQYGLVGNGYSGPSTPYDLDYACG